MADYKAPVLEIAGKASGDLRKALAYVQGSPLGPIVGEQFMSLSGSGPAQYEVQTHAAGHRGRGARRIAGAAARHATTPCVPRSTA